MKSNFHIIFKTYKDKKQLESSRTKNSENYETTHNETNLYEEKPINIDDFNEVEEKEVKENVEKRKVKRGEVAEKNTLLKKKENKRNLRKKRKKCGNV